MLLVLSIVSITMDLVHLTWLVQHAGTRLVLSVQDTGSTDAKANHGSQQSTIASTIAQGIHTAQCT